MPSNRAQEWDGFAGAVHDHIEGYTVPQYGDAPSDPVSAYTVADIKRQLERYVSRIGTGARGRAETMRDAFKIAHYACLLAARYAVEHAAQVKEDDHAAQ